MGIRKSTDGGGIRRGRPWWKRWSRDDTELFALSLPTLLWFLIFTYLPMFGIIIAFKNYRLQPGGHGFIYNLLHSEWAGFGNFKYFFTSNSFTMLLRNTILYNIAFIIISASVAVGGALMLSSMRNKRGSKVYQTMMFLPYFMSWVVVSYFVYALLTPERGYINGIITALGGERIMWYQENKYWPFILIFLNTWKGMGYGMVIYLASITGIDPSLYEAATVDGASKWQKMMKIDIPLLMPTATIMFILRMGSVMSVGFEKVYLLQNNLNTASSEIISTYVYKMGLVSSQYSLSSAIGLFNNLINLALLLAVNYISSKMSDTSLV